MRVAFSNLGCKLNQAEIDAMAQRFFQAGHEIVSSIEQAEVHIVNSCAVTHVAARDSRKIARRGHRLSSGIKTILTGCYVVAEPREAAQLAGVDLVVPNSDKDKILEKFHEAFPDCDPAADADPAKVGPYRPISISPSRPLVKIEDGCNMKCSFCIIPSTRGPQYSRDPAQVVSQIQALEDAGFREVVITGVQISSYRWGDARLPDLVRTILARTESIRLRLTSIAPWQFENDLLDTFASGRVCRHFHLSLQSGCRETLRRMRRPYSPDQFLDLVDRIRSVDPRVALTTDIIVGFPGETDDEFQQSLDFAAHIGFARMHVFPYSRRSNTEASHHPDPVLHAKKRERMSRMLEIAEQAQSRFQNKNLGTEARVLWEDSKSEYSHGTSDNYLRVRVRSAQTPKGEISRVRLTGSHERGMEGKLVSDVEHSSTRARDAQLDAKITSVGELRI